MATVVAFHAHPDDEVLLTWRRCTPGSPPGPRSRTASTCAGSPLVRLPVSLFGLVAGREWYAEPGAESARPIGDVLQPAPRAEGTVRR